MKQDEISKKTTKKIISEQNSPHLGLTIGINELNYFLNIFVQRHSSLEKNFIISQNAAIVFTYIFKDLLENDLFLKNFFLVREY